MVGKDDVCYAIMRNLISVLVIPSKCKVVIHSEAIGKAYAEEDCFVFFITTFS